MLEGQLESVSLNVLKMCRLERRGGKADPCREEAWGGGSFGYARENPNHLLLEAKDEKAWRKSGLFWSHCRETILVIDLWHLDISRLKAELKT